jgi:hypothetical protein
MDLHARLDGKARAATARPANRPGVRVPLAVWIGAGVVAAHALFFWLVWDKHFLPKVPPAPPTPPPVNFGVRETQSRDPQTGETLVERDFSISTHLATPPSSPAVSKSP